MIRPSKLTVVPLVILYNTVETLCHISMPHDCSGGNVPQSFALPKSA